jgi:hypothetical protein
MKSFIVKHFSVLIVVLLLFSIASAVYDPDDDCYLDPTSSISAIDADDGISHATVIVPTYIFRTPLREFVDCLLPPAIVFVLIQTTPLLNLPSRASPAYVS